MKKRLHIIPAVLILVLLSLGACSLFNGNKQEEPLARVFEHYLYPSDLAEAIPAGTPAHDSTILAGRYIDTWIKDQLMLNRAEHALPEEQKDFEKQIEEYRRSLIIFTYREILLRQKLDTLVRTSEIESYYQENQSNFILGQDVIKGTYVKVPLSSPRINELRTWSRSNQEEDLVQMEKYCLSYAEQYDNFNDRWIYFESVLSQIPLTVSQPSRYLRYNRDIETTDSASSYFLHISDHVPEGEVAPLDMVAEDISSIILNKRKINFFRDLEQKVYNDGVNRNQFEIYQ